MVSGERKTRERVFVLCRLGPRLGLPTALRMPHGRARLLATPSSDILRALDVLVRELELL